MQDKNLHINKKFTDRAWLEMRALLDEEMPVKDSKKRLLGWWVMGSLGVAALLSGVYFFTTLTTEKLNAENDKPKFIANSTILSNLKKNIEEKLYTKTLEGTSTSTSKKPLVVSDVHFTKKKKETISSFVKPIDNQVVGQVEIIEKNIPEISPIIKSNEKPIAANLMENKKEGFILNERTADKIGIVSLKKLAMDKNLPLDIDPKPFFKKRKKQVVYASILGVPHTKINGFSAGYLRQLNHNTKGFVYEIGLGYSVINQPINYVVTEGFQEDNGSGLPSGNIFNSSVFDLSYSNNTSVRVLDSQGAFSATTTSHSFDQLQLHYISIPFQTTYHIDQWSVNAGMQTNILLATRNKKIGGGLLNEGGFKDSNGPLLLNQPFRNSADGNATLSNFDFTATVGTGFQISDHLSVQLQYLHGFKDVIKVNNQMDHNRLLQLSARYAW